MCFYNKTLLNSLPSSCRMMPFISRSKSVARTSEEFKLERSINVLRFVCAKQLVQLLLRPIERGSSQQTSLLGFGLLGLEECRTDGCWQLFDHVIGVGDQLGSRFDQLMGGKFTGWVTLPGTPNTSLPDSIARRAVITC